MFRFISLVIFLLFYISVDAQPVSICLGEDTTLCPGQSLQITNCLNSINPTSPSAISLDAPSYVYLTDDVFSPMVNIGFSFNFFGNSYTQCTIGSNGIVNFNASMANAYCAYSLNGTPIPGFSNTTTQNSIMLAYQDIHPGLGGSIQYQTVGVAPYRKFVIVYQNIMFFSCTTVCNFIALVLNETDNTIEMHIGNKPICGQFNGGLAIQGVMNSNGTVAFATPGRNNTVWSANQDSQLYTPTSPSNTNAYTISQIPYTQVIGQGGTLQWVSTAGATYPYNNGVLNIPAVPAGTTGYYITGSACNSSLGSVSDTSWIIRDNITAQVSVTTDYCSSGQGTASISNPVGDGPFTFNFTPSGLSGQAVTGLSAGNHIALIGNAGGCTLSIPFQIPNSLAIASATSTPVTCPGGSDGSATALLTPSQGTITYNWYDAGGSTNAMVTGLSAGTYHCEITSSLGCVDTATVIIAEIPGLTIANNGRTDVTCNSGSDGSITLLVSQGTAPYTYQWSASNSNTNFANDLVVGNHSVIVTDANGCTSTYQDTLGQPLPLSIASMTQDTVVCRQAIFNLHAQGAGGSSAYIYTWKSNGQTIGTGEYFTLDASLYGTQFCLELSELCGSPIATQCINVSYPNDLIPVLTPDQTRACQPAVFTYTNDTPYPNEILTTYITFGNGKDTLVQGAGQSSSTYLLAQYYSVSATVTSIYGCTYTANFPALVEATMIPTAGFNMSANPTTIFETEVRMQDKSLPNNIVQWNWLAPDASPMISSNENPLFRFPEGETGQYPITLIVTTDAGCKDTLTHYLTVVSDILFFAPNTFTPDGDEFNQSWSFVVQGIDEYKFDLFIFNRWGEIIWESHDPNVAWDGIYGNSVVPDGVYIWKSSVKDLYSDFRKDFSGIINVIK